jgi:hypothetical protein
MTRRKERADVGAGIVNAIVAKAVDRIKIGRLVKRRVSSAFEAVKNAVTAVIKYALDNHSCPSGRS